VSRVVAIGGELELAGYALAGVEVVVADDADTVRRAWSALGGDVGLVLLTAHARRSLPEALHGGDVLWVELPS
jgi:vacuolar-type H+-ATPase subunit F/Vma7